jgi:hypothetical protein
MTSRCNKKIEISAKIERQNFYASFVECTGNQNQNVGKESVKHLKSSIPFKYMQYQIFSALQRFFYDLTVFIPDLHAHCL